MELLLTLLFWVSLGINTVLEAALNTIKSAPQLVTNFLFIQLVILYPARRIWKHKDALVHKKRTSNNVAAGVSSVSTSHIAGLHTLF